MNALVEIIESSNLRQFFNALQRHGEVFTLEEMYSRDNKESFKIAVGMVIHKFNFVEEGERKLLKIDLKEVLSNGQKGKLFHMFLFGSFAVALKDMKLKKNACIAFRSAYVENLTSYHRYEGDHDLQACLGCPDKKGAKIFLLAERNKDLNNSAVIPAKRRVAQDEERPISSAHVKKIYKYKRISELTIPESNVNMYGVVSQILRGVNDPDKCTALRVIDETCNEGQDFQVHVCLRNDHINPRFDVGDIVRFHRMQVEEDSGGRIFRASDMVTFPPNGTGKEGAYSTAQRFHFAEFDEFRLAELRQWIESRKKEKNPTDSVLMIGNVSEEGKYAVRCQILKIHKITDDILILTATDCVLSNGQTKKKEVPIIAIAAPDQLETIPLNTNIILNDVIVSTIDEPEPERMKFIYKMLGPSYTFEVLRGSEDEADIATSQSREMECNDEENTAVGVLQDQYLKHIFVFNSLFKRYKDAVELQNIQIIYEKKLELLTEMKEATAGLDLDVENNDHSLMGALNRMIEDGQLDLNVSGSTPVPNAPKECQPSTSKSK